ncbi:hypothetical protein G7Y89_g5725 [Cudoniella acicularis]|uniref:Heterokaryon incompatibility domain-containing protein n=1 Tax=Cudoniella acicularis TaxID=354080 RepID=A0A8H4W352_9HELO|nr:hypothetical protein G7Y89_g5725 [Cudoniella acicularis]
MKLLRNPWFQRIWVVQEVCLAASLRIVYGQRDIPWQMFIEGISTFGRHPNLTHLLEWTEDFKFRQARSETLETAILMDQFRRKVQLGEELSISDLLIGCQMFKAMDARDKIFGLHGMCSRKPTVLMLPSYVATVEQVFLNAAHSLLEENHVDKLLALAGVGYYQELNKELKYLPSWVPDWSRAPQVLTFADQNLSRGLNYKAGGKASLTPSVQNKSSLIVPGLQIDTIAQLGPIFDIQRGEDGKCNITELKKLMDAHN